MVSDDGASKKNGEPSSHSDHQSGGKTATEGPLLVGAETRMWAVAGLLIGAVFGSAVGLALGHGTIGLRPLAPLSAGSALVPAFVVASVFAAAGALVGALLGTRAEGIPATEATERKEHRPSPDPAMPMPGGGWLAHLPIEGAVVLMTIMALTLYGIGSAAIGSGAPSDQANRVHWQLKNATRIGGVSDRRTGLAALEAAYPGTRPENRAAMAVVVPSDWRVALAATPLIARPTNAALMTMDAGDAAETTDDQIAALRASGVLDAAAVFAPTPAIGSDAITSAAELADAVDSQVTRATGRQISDVLIVAADAPAQWALPAAAYAARTGTPIVFVTAGGIPPASARVLARRSGAARIYIVGPPSVIGERTEQALRRSGRVTRISGRTPERNAISFAEFQDPHSDFGWGHTGRGPRALANMNSILVSDDRWQDGIAAAHLARSTGKSGPLLLTHGPHLPAATESYFWRVRPAHASTPAEGPYSNVWVVGSFVRIPYVAQARADYAGEIEQYMTLGDSALSGFEALALAWLAFAIASAVWIAYHAGRRVRDMMPMMRAAWVLFALMLGPVAVWWYIGSYDKRPVMKMKDAGHGNGRDKTSANGAQTMGRGPAMTMWERPLWARVVSATVMMFAFDMMLMVLVVFMLAYIGFPIIQANGPLYWMGTSMFLMMIAMYFVALLLMLLVFHTPMTMHERGIDSYWRAFVVGAPVMIATMTVESIGMMPTMWWAQMAFLPSMQMPTGDDFTMWATLLMSVAVALVVVLPFNYVLVRRGIKQGTM